MNEADAVILKQWYAQRDAEAFNTILARYSAMVYATCLRILRNSTQAADVTQECFESLVTATRPPDKHLGSWLHRVATNLSLKHIRTDQRRRTREALFTANQATHVEASWDDIYEYVDQAIAELPERYRVPLVAYYLERRPQSAIATELGVTQSTIAYRVSQAVDLIGKALKKRGVTVPATLAALLTANFAQAEPLPAAVTAALGKLALVQSTKGAAAGIPTPQPAASRTWGWRWSSLNVYGTIVVVLAAIAGATATVCWSHSPSPRPETTNSALRHTEASSPARDDASLSAKTADKTVVVTTEHPSGTTAQDIAASAAPPLEEATETVTIHCVDEQGAPIAGAQVYFAHAESHASIMRGMPDGSEIQTRFSTWATTDRSGLVRYVGVPVMPADERRAISTSRFAYACVVGQMVGGCFSSPARPATTPIELLMTPSRDIRGHVSAPPGFDPMSIEVRVAHLQIGENGNPHSGSFPYYHCGPIAKGLPQNLFVATPNSEGEFTLSDIPTRGVLYLVAEAPGLAQTYFRSSELDSLEKAEITMEPEGSLDGQLTYTSSRAPAPGVAIVVNPVQGREASKGILLPVVARTDSAGRFHVGGLGTGAYTLLPAGRDVPAEWTAAPHKEVVRVGQVVTGVNLQLEKGAIVSGSVTNSETGTPVAQATLVALSPGTGGRAVDSVTTDSNGAYHMRLPAGSNLLYLCSIPDGFTYSKDQGRRTVYVKAAAESIAAVDYQLASTKPSTNEITGEARARGLVLDDQGQPVAGASIYMNRKYTRGETAFQDQVRSGRTDADGRYEVAVLAPSEFQILAGGGYYTARSSESFKAEPGKFYDVPNLALELATGAISGLVVDPAGQPISHAVVNLKAENYLPENRDIVTGSDGRFSADHVPSNGPVSVEITVLGFKHFEAPARLEPDQLFTLEPETVPAIP